MHAFIGNNNTGIVHGRLPIVYVTGQSCFFVPSEVSSQTPGQETSVLNISPVHSPVQVVDFTASSSVVFTSGSGASHTGTEWLSLADSSQLCQLAPRSSYDAIENQEMKILFCGDHDTGKTSLMQRIINADFSCKHNQSVSFK